VEFGDERFLLGGLDSLRAVRGADPGDRIGGGNADQGGETGQRRTRAPMAAKTADFHLPAPAITTNNSTYRSQAGNEPRIIPNEGMLRLVLPSDPARVRGRAEPRTRSDCS
jgi:hypothetical protein